MRITYPAALVLEALASGYRFGFEIMDFTGLPSGTTYPILRRFESEKLVRSRWEKERDALAEGRPRRRYYELTDLGRKARVTTAERFAVRRRVFEETAALDPQKSS